MRQRVETGALRWVWFATRNTGRMVWLAGRCAMLYYKCLRENACHGQSAVRFHVQSWARTISASRSPGFVVQQGKTWF